MIASQSVVAAPPDGHTLLFVTDAMTTIEPMLPGGNGSIRAGVRSGHQLGLGPLFLAAEEGLPANSLAELVEYGKKNPNALNFGTSGPDHAAPDRRRDDASSRPASQMTHVAYAARRPR